MKVAVIGAGIIGVTTAYELSADGHRVTVFERHGSVAAEASFANAGVIAPGYVTPWAAPGMTGKVLRHLFSSHSPVRLNIGLAPGTAAWLWQWWRACRPHTYQANRVRMQRLAGYSRDRLHDMARHMKLDFERTEGYLVLLRTPRDESMAQAGLESLVQLGTRFDRLTAAQCRIVEPGLSTETALHAGIHLPDDEVGNCRQFAHLLRHEAQRLGARFRFHTAVERIIAGHRPQLEHTHTLPREATIFGASADAAQGDARDTQPMDRQSVTEGFDAVIVCAALGAHALLRPHGLKLPLQAVHGYSLTAPLRMRDGHIDIGPRSGLMDERYKVAISRLGARIRVAGGAEIGGSLSRHHAGAVRTLHKVLHDWYPGAARAGQAQLWKGARPMLPDGPPVLGRSGIDGIWLNLGHGSSGWALACGSARLLADSVAGRPPAIDTEGLGVDRLLL